MRFTIQWFALFIAVASPVLGQQLIQGKVIDQETGNPIPFASIGILGTSKGTSSNLQGEFSLVITNQVAVKVSCIGYESRIVSSLEEIKLILLAPVAKELDEIFILSKDLNPRRVVRKAFASIRSNYDTRFFLQNFFYRHYSKRNSVYERLIEASVDVWKNQGYRHVRSTPGENEEMRITQLRRSLDIKEIVQQQTPIWLNYILQTDVIGYQAKKKSEYLKFHGEASNLWTDFDNYSFSFEGITNYDGQEVYRVSYEHKKDSVLTSRGYVHLTEASGSLFITTDSYAIVKSEEVKHDDINTVKTTAYYRKYAGKFYPYHFVREGETLFADGTKESFHLELMSVEIRFNPEEKFTGKEPGRDELLRVPYDSSFWNNTTILKTTPLEDAIIRDLGGGRSLNKQFHLYKQYELNVTDGGIQGEEKFNWLLDDSRYKRAVYVVFWNSDFKNYLADMEYVKRVHQKFKTKILFVLVSLENDEYRWKQLVKQYNFFADGIINYRVGSSADLLRRFKVRQPPAFMLISPSGEVNEAIRPSDQDIHLYLEKIIREY